MARPLLLNISFSWSLQHATPQNAKPEHLNSLQTFSMYIEVTCCPGVTGVRAAGQQHNIHASPKAALDPAFSPSISLFLELLFH